VGVIASGIGIDLLLIAVVGLFLLILERTLGDWMGEKVGAGPAAIVFALVLIGFTWYVIDSSDSFFAAAEERGYRSLYYRASGAAAASTDDTDKSSGALPTSAPVTSAGGTRIGSTNVNVATEREPERTSSAEVPRAEAAKPAVADKSKAQSSGTIAASTIIFGPASKSPSHVSTTTVLSVERSVAPARRVVLKGVVIAQGHPVDEGSVDFIVDGVSLGKRLVDSNGIATADYVSPLSGTYEMRAHFSGTFRYAPSSSGVQTIQIAQR
jgi:hypothetical protein